MANGLDEVLPNRPFRVRVVNSSEKDRKLPKGMVLGKALPFPTGIVSLAELDPKPLANHPPKWLQVVLSPEEYVTRLDLLGSVPSAGSAGRGGYVVEVRRGPRPPHPPGTR
jgi:hypothetical protein